MAVHCLVTAILKTWSCIFSLYNLCSDTFPPGDPLRPLGEGSPGAAFSSGSSRPRGRAREALLKRSCSHPRTYRAQTSALQSEFNIKQRCPGVRLAASKVQAAEAEVIKE